MKFIARVTLLIGILSLAPLQGAEIILNEYNAVGSTRWLDVDGLDASDKADTRLGRIEGNGGNWFELAVVGDGMAGSDVDMRGWTLGWSEGDDNGKLVLSSDGFWSAVPAGTLLTFAESEVIAAQDGGEVVHGTDIGLDFSAGDHWAHIYTADPIYIAATETNVADDQDELGNAIFGRFSVGNDDWQLTISNDILTVFGPLGEGTDGISAGVGSREVFKLEANVTTTVDVASYSDGSSSSFGAPNVWSGDDDVTFTQDFSRFGVVPEPTSFASLCLWFGLVLINSRRPSSHVAKA